MLFFNSLSEKVALLKFDRAGKAEDLLDKSCVLAFVSFFIKNCGNGEFFAGADGGNNFQLVAGFEVVALLNGYKAVGIIKNFSDEGAFLDICAGISVAHFHFTEIESAGIGAVADAVQLTFNNFHGNVAVDGVAVSVYCRCNIERSFHASFDFVRTYSCRFKLVEKTDGAHIMGTEDSGAFFVLHHLEEFIGAFLLNKVIAPAARLCAAAAVSASVNKIGRNHAAARIGHAHCAVNECFNGNV